MNLAGRNAFLQLLSVKLKEIKNLTKNERGYQIMLI